MKQSKVLVIYTGGTIGMVRNHATGGLQAFDFDHLFDQIPELKRLDVELSAISFEKPIDSSEMSPAVWKALVGIVFDNYDIYDGFVILHGSDTMSFTASALSFMLQGLRKPIILTGSQLPIGTIRTDGKENFITAVEIAAMKDEYGNAVVQEVAIYFEYSLYRGNRTAKVSSSDFEAFKSGNHPELARAGVDIKFNHNALYRTKLPDFVCYPELDTRIANISLFPGIDFELYESIFDAKRVNGIVLSTFGSGNGPQSAVMNKLMGDFIQSGGLILNISQCFVGGVHHGKYDSSKQFLELGVLEGGTMTREAAITKLMHVLPQSTDNDFFKHKLTNELSGEM
jgi:L-asparaginase